VLTTQESLEALAGRSADGKPLVFVSQQDYDALRKQYEALLETTKQAKRDWGSWATWIISVAAIGIAIFALAYQPGAAAQVEPFGGYFYAANNVAGVHAANAFCMARKEERQMRPGLANGFGPGGLVFVCVKSEEELAADKREAARKGAEP
jgi:hypothetical protein